MRHFRKLLSMIFIFLLWSQSAMAEQRSISLEGFRDKVRGGWAAR